MRIFYILLKNEIFKCLNAPLSILLMSILMIPVLVVFGFIYLMPYEEFVQRANTTSSDHDPFNYFFKWFKILFGIILIPFYSIFLIWFFEIERKSQGWKSICSLPVSFLSVLFAKILTALSFVLISLSLSCAAYFAAIVYLKEFKTDWLFNSYPALEIGTLSIIFFGIFITSFPALLILLLAIMIFDSPGLILISSSFIALFSFPYNPFHFHVNVLESYLFLRNGDYPNFDIYIISIVSIIMIIVGITMYSNNLKKLL